jgi:hypothetical protein
VTSSVVFSMFFSLSIFSYAENGIEQRLREFHQNPAQAMDRLPDQVVNGQAASRGFINYVEVEKTLDYRNEIRGKILEREPGFKPWIVFDKQEDNPATLVEKGDVISNIIELDSAGHSRAVLPQEKSPWGDSYWPMYKGLIASRYADPGYPKSKLWVENYSYIMSHPAYSVLSSGSSRAINNLSPAEKYDLLMGDHNMTLTRYAWNEGKRYFERTGKVAKWMGICHGWSAAAHMLAPNIKDPVTLRTPGGTRITFYQSDIKALNSMLWAEAYPFTLILGNRCKVSKPNKNKFGRILDPYCWDNNPGAYHLALLNQIGRHHRSFVMDSTYDAQVWNFAITSYKSTYFNPQRLRPTMNIKEAIIPIENFTLDKFKEFRSPDARYIVGVAMDVTYVAAVNPSHRIPKDTMTKTYRYYYDLELDSNHKIIGGEWYSNAHPDFIWTFAADSQAKSKAEEDLDPYDWDLSNPVPRSWTAAARSASAAGIPMSIVIKRIVGAVPEEGEEPEGPPPTEDDSVPTPDTPPDESTPEDPGSGTPAG